MTRDNKDNDLWSPWWTGPDF